MTPAEIDGLDWAKGDGLLPAIVQHADSGAVLMLGYMNREALARTLAGGEVTFYSRSRGRLWTKGETSGNTIAVTAVTPDCDRDTLLVLGRPAGPVCHTGAADCFHGQPPALATRLEFLHRLETVIAERIAAAPESSYTAKLYAKGPSRMAQKVGEEGLEVALAAVGADDAQLVSESADLLYHLLLLLQSRGRSLAEVVAELQARHRARETAPGG
jgi:phosphoribosyl-ATP pyrophosphohydrolase/phosphoribosyl-AMP cyclohydrolase